ncbi:MAG: AAA family ATPase [Mangrovibacterium sp.]
MRKYPIGIQTFSEIINEGYIYMDKTQLIHQLITSGKYYFLSRPRRFGKSLLLSTIEEIFKGSKGLFKGLWIEDRWDWTQKHPVIHISFSDIGVATLGMTTAIFKALKQNADRLGVVLEETVIDQQFAELIRKASVNGKVVILIDEYDKGIIDYLDDIPLAESNRTVMKNFYSVIKGSDAYIRLLLITGVSRFSKVSIFSDLNNLYDITLHPKYGTLTGITQEELERDFCDEIGELQQTDPNILEKLKKWYDGYSWNIKDRVYNPFSLLSFMGAGVFGNFWFQTGTPTFLVKLIQRKGEFKFEDTQLSEIALGSFDIENPLPAALLFQTGYLTIREYDSGGGVYSLDYPNKEVEQSLVDALLSAYRCVFPGDSAAVTNNLRKALLANDISRMIEELNAVTGSIPYDHWRADHESIFHIIMHLTFKKIGVDIESEVHSSRGRCDVLIKTSTHIYAIELKLNSSAQQALDQIFEKGYLHPYQSDLRQKVAIGINFSSEKREIEQYLVKEATRL